MPNFIDLTGQRFGRLTVLSIHSKDKHNHLKWLCKCDCGNEVGVMGGSLARKTTQSCGCLKRESFASRNIGRGKNELVRTPIYNTWIHMRQRCHNPNSQDYRDYGGRGIKVCEKWQTFEGFYEDMGSTYQSGLSIDRINVNGDYCKDNCRWATLQEQANNKRNNRIETINGVTDTLTNLCRLYGINERAVRTRLKSGWGLEKSLKTPIRPHKKYKEYGK